MRSNERWRLDGRSKIQEAEDKRAKDRLKAFIITGSAVLLITTTLSAIALSQLILAARRGQELEKSGAELATQIEIALSEEERAKKEKERADQEARISQSSILAQQAASVLDSDPELSLALAYAAIGKAKTAAAERALRQSLVESHTRAVLTPHDGAADCHRLQPRRSTGRHLEHGRAGQGLGCCQRGAGIVFPSGFAASRPVVQRRGQEPVYRQSRRGGENL